MSRNAFTNKFTTLQQMGLPSLLISNHRLLSHEKYAHRVNVYVANQITASSSTSEDIVPPTGQSLYDKLEGLFFIGNEVNHLFETPPNLYRHTEAEETLIKMRRHQMPKEDWWQFMLQIFPR